MHKQDRLQFLVSGILVVFLILLSGGMGMYVCSDPAIPLSMQFMRVAEIISQRYPLQADLDAAAKNARDAVFDQLDRYSFYVPPVGFEHFKEEREGAYVGIGVSISSYEDGLMVADVKKDGPADSAGVLAGDIILGTDSVLFANYKDDPTQFLRGKAGTKVNVIIYRAANNDTLTIPIIRRAVPLSSVPYAGRTPNNTLYIRVLNFDAGVSDQLESAIDSLLDASPKTPCGLILDMRGNPGGMFYEAYQTASLFFDTTTFLVGTKGRSIWDEKEYYSHGSDITNGLPMAVLCDGGSASAAEIVSGALQKAKRAVLIGDTTFGKGLVQGYTQYPEGDGLRLTISRYYFVDGQYLNKLDSVLHDVGSGLIPDYYVNESHPLANVLDNHDILLLFAAKYQDELLQPNRTAVDDSMLIAKLQAFTEKNGVRYQSSVAYAINNLAMAWQERFSSVRLPGVLDTLVDMAHERDSIEYQKESAAVLRLLKQYAVNRKAHEHEMFDKVMVKEDPLILFADSILCTTPKQTAAQLP